MASAEPFSHPAHPLSRVYDDGHVFPLVVSPPSHADAQLRELPSQVVSYLRLHRARLLQLLYKHGVLYFRGFAPSASTPEDFARFVTDGLGLRSFPYALGNAVRTPVVGDIVFTANEAPPERLIPFHHELAQTPRYPAHVAFFCHLPPATGGETPIAHSVPVLRSLRERIPDFVDKCAKHGVIYRRSMTPHDRPDSAIGRGWRSTFGAETREQAEQVLREKKYRWQWSAVDAHDVLTEISPVLKAVSDQRNKGQFAFFNQMYAAWNGWVDDYNKKGQSITYGTGHQINPKHMDVVSQVLEQHSVAIPWEKGDFMLIDNLQAMHSRNSFTGKRRILASLLD